MSSADFHLHFTSKRQSFDIDFHESVPGTKDSILINGRNYVLQGDSLKIAWLKAELPELIQSQANHSFEHLQAKLIDLGAQDISIQSVGLNRLGFETTTANNKQQMLDKVIDHAFTLLYESETSLDKTAILKSLEEPENQAKIAQAFTRPIPWCCPPGHPPPKELDKMENPPVLAGMTMREVMLLGTLATILGKNEILEQICTADLKKDWQVNAGVEFVKLRDGREISYKSFGTKREGVPCIIMQSGLGNGSGIWTDLQNIFEKSSDGYGLSYDRAGYGASDPAQNESPGSIEQVVKDMHSMLTELERQGKINPPYILVGHSFGGSCMQLYANMYADKISGLVLVDSSDDQRIFDQRILSPQPWEAQNDTADLMPPSTCQVLFHEMRYFLSVKSEDEGLMNSMKTLNDAVNSSPLEPFFGKIPLRVITSTHSLGDEPEKIAMVQAHLEHQEQLLERSSNSKQILSTLGHFIHCEDPGIVADAIRSI